MQVMGHGFSLSIPLVLIIPDPLVLIVLENNTTFFQGNDFDRTEALHAHIAEPSVQRPVRGSHADGSGQHVHFVNCLPRKSNLP